MVTGSPEAPEVAGAMPLVAAVAEWLQAGRTVVTATVVTSDLPGVRPGAWMLFGGPSQAQGRLGHPDLEAAAGRAALELLQVTDGPPEATRGHARSLVWPAETAPARVRLYVERLAPPPILLLVGAGQDTPAMARVGNEAGFYVVVCDHRPAYARRERFPEAQEVHCVAPEAIPERLLTPRTYAVIMNHHFFRDAETLRRLLGFSLPYIGILGPRRRTQRLLAHLEATAAIRPSEETLRRIYSPVGIDIGGEGPGAIAVGVIGEVMAVRFRRPVPHLRDRRKGSDAAAS